MNGTAQASRTFYLVLTLVLVVAALRLAEDVFVPLALAVVLTFLLAPVVDRLQRSGVNRKLAVLVTVAITFGVIVGVLYMVFGQLRDLARELPQYHRQLLHNVNGITGVLRGGLGRFGAFLSQLSADLRKVAPGQAADHTPRVEVVEPPLGSLESLRQLVSPIVGPIVGGALVLVFVTFMLIRFADLRERIVRLLGSRNLRVATEALDEAARRVSRYLMMQTLVNGWEGLCVAVGLSLIGVPNAVLWGALTMVLRFIPYLGIFVAAGMPLLLSFAVFDSWTKPVLVLGLFLAVEALSYAVLEPWLYSRRTGVSPVALLIAAVFWAWLWGAAGLFLAIPLTVCLVVMGKYVPQLAFLHVLLGDQPVLAPHERLYQRLLANNPEEADDLLEAQLREHSLLALCDNVMLPAIHLVERDHEQGVLREAKRQYVLDHLERWSEELADAVAARKGNGRPGLEGNPPAAAPRVLCLAAADRGDEIAARLLVVTLQERGLSAQLLARAQVRTAIHEGPPAVTVISALPRDAVAHARYMCRRVHAQFREVPVIVGLWHTEGDVERSWNRLVNAGAARLVTTFAEALREIEALAAGSAAAPAPPAVPPIGASSPPSRVSAWSSSS